jgi:hypothetical protein
LLPYIPDGKDAPHVYRRNGAAPLLVLMRATLLALPLDPFDSSTVHRMEQVGYAETLRAVQREAIDTVFRSSAR